MIIKAFNGMWFGYMALLFLLSVVMYATLRSAPIKHRKWFVAIMSAFSVFLFVVYKYWLFVEPGFSFIIWNELPLNPCNLIPIIAIPAALTNRRPAQALCFLSGTLSVLCALLAPVSDFKGISILGHMGIGFYGTHGLAVLICLSFPLLGLYRPKLRDIPMVMLLTFSLMTVDHLFNMLMRATVFPGADYFFTYGVPNSVVSDWLRTVIPYDLFFLLPGLAFLVIWCPLLIGICRLAGRISNWFPKPTPTHSNW